MIGVEPSVSAPRQASPRRPGFDRSSAIEHVGAVHRDACGAGKPEATRGLDACRRHLDHPVVAVVGDEHVAGRVDRRGGGQTQPGADRGLHAGGSECRPGCYRCQ